MTNKMITLRDFLSNNLHNPAKVSSTFIHSNLKVDDVTVEPLRNIKEFLTNKDLVDKTFHSQRIVGKGVQYSYCVPELLENDEKIPLVINKTAFEQEFDNINYNDKDTLNFFQGSFANDKNEITPLWQTLINKFNIIPYSQAYAGFQFGNFAGQLGDGRVCNLLDINNKTIQIKGGGLTPYSRFADGNATLKASIREFIISESLNSIGIDSTRALLLSYLPGKKARRGAKLEPRGLVTRYAKTWIRLGSFDIHRWRQDFEGIAALSDYCIEHVFGEKEDSDYIKISNLIDISCENDAYDVLNMTKYDKFLRDVVQSNAKAVAKWNAYGFANGVLNTDNTSIIGTSMDYGPFGFIEAYDEDWTPNVDDSSKRYSIGNQSKIIWWNLLRFSESQTMLIGSGRKYIDRVKNKTLDIDKDIAQYLMDRTVKILEYIEAEYDFYYNYTYVSEMLERLGLNPKLIFSLDCDITKLNEHDFVSLSKNVSDIKENLIDRLLNVLKQTRVDYNDFFIKFQQVDTVGFVNKDKTIKDEYLDCFTAVHEQIDFSATETCLNNIDKLFDANSVDVDSPIYKDFFGFLQEYNILWASNNQSRSGSVKELKMDVSKLKNPLFIPRHYHFNEVYKSLEDTNFMGTDKLEKLYLMSSNPYDPSKWENNKLSDVEKRWTNLDQLCKAENSLNLCGCSS